MQRATPLRDCPVQHVRYVVEIVRHMHLDYVVALPVEQPSARVLLFAARLIVADDNQ